MATKKGVELDPTAEDNLTKKSLDWFFTLSEDGQTCPVCGAEFFDGTEAEKKRNLIGHGRTKHLARIVLGFPTKNIEAISQVEDEVEDMWESAGLGKVEQLSRHDYLAVPPDIERQAKRDGANVRWISGNNIERFKNHGMEVVTNDSGQPVRSGDLTLFRIPNRLRRRYAEQRERMRQNQPAARREDLERRIEGAAKNLYDTALKKGHSRDVARNLARSAERGLATGSLSVRRG